MGCCPHLTRPLAETCGLSASLPPSHLARRYLTLAQAQSKAMVVDWKDPINKPVKPQIIGTKVFKAFPIEDVVEYIDWNPFFQVGSCAAP